MNWHLAIFDFFPGFLQSKKHANKVKRYLAIHGMETLKKLDSDQVIQLPCWYCSLPDEASRQVGVVKRAWALSLTWLHIPALSCDLGKSYYFSSLDFFLYQKENANINHVLGFSKLKWGKEKDSTQSLAHSRSLVNGAVAMYYHAMVWWRSTRKQSGRRPGCFLEIREKSWAQHLSVLS